MSSTVDPRTRHVRTIDVASFVAELHASIGRVVIDVRTAEEFAQGHIHGAVLLDFRSLEFDRGLQQIGPNKKYAIYCRSGNRSGQAADAMRALGFGDVVDLDGGIVAQSVLVVASRVDSATAELITMTRRDVPMASGIGSLSANVSAGTITKPPPTPKSPVRNPTAVPAARTVATVRGSIPRRSAGYPEAPDNAAASPTRVHVGQPVTMRHAATQTRAASRGAASLDRRGG